MTDPTDDERVLGRAFDAASRLAEQCADLRARDYPARGAGIDDVVSALTGALIEQGFSELEVRRAFHNALAEMERFALGQERRA